MSKNLNGKCERRGCRVRNCSELPAVFYFNHFYIFKLILRTWLFCLYTNCPEDYKEDTHMHTHFKFIHFCTGYWEDQLCNCIFLQRDIFSSLNSSWQRSECLTFLKCKVILLLQRVNGSLMIVSLNLRDLMRRLADRRGCHCTCSSQDSITVIRQQFQRLC